MRWLRALALITASAAAVPASAVTIDWTYVGNPNNPPVGNSSNCQSFSVNCGSVDHVYNISKYEITNAQYAEFLNAVDASGINTLALYSASMGTDATFGGISLVAGNAAGSKYVVKSGFA